jgi:hypothetical protein
VRAVERVRAQLDDAAGPASLDATARRLVAAMWLGRAEAEARAVLAFEAIGEDLAAIGAPAALREIATRAIDEEAMHATLCLELARSYGGPALAAPRPGYQLPPFAGALPAARPVLRVLLTCALSESISSAFIARCHERATAPAVRELTHLLLSDEIDHARLGWGLLALPALDAPIRAVVGGMLPSLCETIVRTWRSAPAFAPALAVVVSGHGCLPWGEVDELVQATLRTLVLPGFATLGVDTGPAQRWLDSLPPGRPTMTLRGASTP